MSVNRQWRRGIRATGREARVIWRKPNCLNPSLQKAYQVARRKQNA
jgi:hypothetical protein